MSNSFQPVWDGYLADPFVWRHEEWYYATGTGDVEAADGFGDASNADIGEEKIFPILRSSDLKNWEKLGAALVRPDHALGYQFWAPELAYNDGTFYLYYSIGPKHQLRVATSKLPEGPYIDAGLQLTSEPQSPFAIDASPFQDDDGQWYLFYARDFLDEDQFHAGTSLAVDRMGTMTQLTGEEKVVVRARFDWTIFEKNREIYDRLWAQWHTIEGAQIIKHEGVYYCFYSGACYGTDSYGVDYLTAAHPLGPWNDEGSDNGPRVLKSVPGKLIGPGHNSLVVGPDSRDYIVFHAWNEEGTKRQMHIEPLEWTAEGPRVVGL